MLYRDVPRRLGVYGRCSDIEFADTNLVSKGVRFIVLILSCVSRGAERKADSSSKESYKTPTRRFVIPEKGMRCAPLVYESWATCFDSTESSSGPRGVDLYK